MKPSSSDAAPKGALSKTLKKTAKSRSKLLKVNTSQTAATPQVIPQEPSTSATPECLREKTFHRNFAGFGPKTVKIMWEQHDTDETDIVPEAYPRVAEDVSFKLWEVINNIKTYARHSGGKVTGNLVNEVFKACDVPPVLGTSEIEWERIEYDESLFFDMDAEKTIDLREEYQRPICFEQTVNVELTRSWAIDKRFSKVVFEFTGCLGRCVFLGDHESFSMGIETAAFSQYIGCCLRLLLRKCVEMLGFEQKYFIINRAYKFLQALSINPYTRDINCNGQLFHLCEIFICHLLGTYESIESVVKKTDIDDENISETVKNIKSETVEQSCETDESIKETKPLNQTDVDDIRTEYEELFHLMERDGFKERSGDVKITPNDSFLNDSKTDDSIKEETMDSIKQERNTDSHDEDDDTMNTQEQKCTSGNKTIPNYAAMQMKMEVEEAENNAQPVEPPPVIKTEYPEQNDNEDDTKKDPEEDVKPEKINKPKPQYSNSSYSPLTADMIDFENVDNICHTVGLMASQFGFVQNECIHLINRRMEKFFNNRFTYNETDYQYISRCVRCLIGLGESAFRDILPYLCQINTNDTPEWIQNDFSLAGVFLGGRDDIFLYEWLEDLCGDKLQPFMIQLYRYHEKFLTKKFKAERKPTYKINPKVSLKIYQRNELFSNKPKIQDVFSEYKEICVSKQIGFKFAGCRPVLKTKAKTTNTVIQKPLDKFHEYIIIAKRKLYKPLVDKKSYIKLSNFCFTQI